MQTPEILVIVREHQEVARNLADRLEALYWERHAAVAKIGFSNKADSITAIRSLASIAEAFDGARKAAQNLSNISPLLFQPALDAVAAPKAEKKGAS